MLITRGIQTIPTPFNLKPVLDITDELTKHPKLTYDLRSPEDITFISVHHSAVEGGTPQGYANYHVNNLGWPGIGYHMVIKGDQIYQTNDLLAKSFHTGGNNHYTVSVSISGDLSKRPLSEVERNCLYAVILTYMNLFNIPVENVLGHNEYPDNKTSCPCIDMSMVREDIKALQMKMLQNDSWEGQIQSISDMIKEFNYLNALIGKGPDDGEAKWALAQNMKIHQFMKQQGLL